MSATIIDTCCLINLYASQHLEAIVGASIDQALIPKMVLSESLHVRQLCKDDPDRLVPKEVDLNPLIKGGILEVTEPTDFAELELFMHLAGIIDDGEAACLAIASNRGHILATDDRRAIKVATELNVSIVTTPDLIKEWVKFTSPEPFQVTETIHCIERYGRFRPHPSSPHAEWWEEQLRWNR